MCNFELSVFLKQHVPKTADEMCLFAYQFREARNTSAQTLCAKVMKEYEVSKLAEKKKKDSLKKDKNKSLFQ